MVLSKKQRQTVDNLFRRNTFPQRKLPLNNNITLYEFEERRQSRNFFFFSNNEGYQRLSLSLFLSLYVRMSLFSQVKSSHLLSSSCHAAMPTQSCHQAEAKQSSSSFKDVTKLRSPSSHQAGAKLSPSLQESVVKLPETIE